MLEAELRNKLIGGSPQQPTLQEVKAEATRKSELLDRAGQVDLPGSKTNHVLNVKRKAVQMETTPPRYVNLKRAISNLRD